ncbi:MAG: gluconate 2-dehydrogenase subunit 3 family protein [Chloroflexi bacterium]|nr:gluconate 2-dehydrogenase subunit 3 family protein [Chloroflexota bacterium]
MVPESADARTSAAEPRLDDLAFLTPHEGATIQALMGRIVPDDDLGPGAIEAGAVYYLDRALAGHLQLEQGRYRAAIRALDAWAVARFGVDLLGSSGEQQNALLDDLANDRGPAGQGRGDGRLGVEFFELARAHTLEGMFSDPVHGGNRDLAGWKLLGYPGAQPSYSHAEQQLDAPIVRDRIFTASDYPLPDPVR